VNSCGLTSQSVPNERNPPAVRRPARRVVVGRIAGQSSKVATFAYYTGWRVQSEVLTLQWHQVDLKAGVVRLDPGTTKNREGRVFPLGMLDDLRTSVEAQRACTEALQRARGEIVASVFHREGQPIRNFRKAWKTACKAAGCPGRIPHDFRRTAMRNLVRAGVPEKTAMQLTGHKTRAVFDRYDIVDESDLRVATGKLNDRWAHFRGQLGRPKAPQPPAPPEIPRNSDRTGP
jgi:integrase